MTEEPSTDEVLNGFRLQRLEIFNWGTFDGRVWTLDLNGRNGLLTGDIGSGKSTLVDAITTLLVPSQRVSYNKAAGADSKERSLRSYVLGHHRSERNESTGSAKPVGLRGLNSYSVILAVFANPAMKQCATLAIVFWMKEAQGQPERFYVTSERDLSIAGDFSGFGTIAQLRKKLRADGADVTDSFPPYGAWFRRRFGIESEQALDLFHQTVSMKSVGNLTEFVRGHMLEPFDSAQRIAKLVEHFEDLNRAHEAVLKAKRQISKLTPLVADCDKHEEAYQQVAGMREARDWLQPHFATLKLELLEKRLRLLGGDHERHNRLIEQLEEQLLKLRGEQGELKQQIAANGGDRLERLAAEIQSLSTDRDNRRSKAARYATLIQALGEPLPGNEPDFQELHHRLAASLEEARNKEADLQNRATTDEVELRLERDKRERLVLEIESLKARRSNIPSDQIAIRAAICQSISLPEEMLPFVGELIQVRESERDWEGAAERVLRSFGLSLLVADEHYAAVSEWVDRTHLRGRLVYFRLRQDRRPAYDQVHRDSLVHKIAIKDDSPHFAWLENELIRRFDLPCCDSYEQFRREAKAITRSGQIKMSGERHEKDDRHRLDDRSRYVLGWSNAAKIAALEAARVQLEEKIVPIMQRIAGFQAEQRQLRDRIGALGRLEEYREYREIDWQTPAAEIARLDDEIQALRSSSDVLRRLAQQLEAAQEQEREVETNLKDRRQELGGIKAKQDIAIGLKQETSLLLAEADSALLQARFEILEAMRTEALGEHQLTVESCDNRERETREWLQKRIDARDKGISAMRERIITAMTDYRREYAIETQEVDVAVESADEFRTMLHALAHDDLPRFEKRFKDSLNENTIREIANFSAQLNRERSIIQERIARINLSLSEIDYNPGRFIRLEAQSSLDPDIRDFQNDLRACTEGSLTGSDDEQYSEAKFLQVRQIVERFRGREGQSEQDRRWTQKVTDVRSWFVFAASERWREDDAEHEHYSDSGGKSGGQKEKLAYTILAASLAYQFGLDGSQVRSRSFRFVVIDEAFGRGSDESAQFGLRLFEKLDLQLLIVTPLQKIHIIEPYVSSVGFVHNEEGRCSKLRNLTIEAYRAEKEQRG